MHTEESFYKMCTTRDVIGRDGVLLLPWSKALKAKHYLVRRVLQCSEFTSNWYFYSKILFLLYVWQYLPDV